MSSDGVSRTTDSGKAVAEAAQSRICVLSQNIRSSLLRPEVRVSETCRHNQAPWTVFNTALFLKLESVK